MDNSRYYYERHLGIVLSCLVHKMRNTNKIKFSSASNFQRSNEFPKMIFFFFFSIFFFFYSSPFHFKRILLCALSVKDVKIIALYNFLSFIALSNVLFHHPSVSYGTLFASCLQYAMQVSNSSFLIMCLKNVISLPQYKRPVCFRFP